MLSPQQKHLAIQPSSNEIAVVDELGNTVGMLVSGPTNYASTPPQNVGLHLRYPVPCSKQASLTTEWLKHNFEENELKSVPRSVMFEEYKRFCQEENIKAFNQAVFGKVVRACFPNLTTRRLGMRGQSRYHYSGLGVMQDSRYAKKFRSIGERSNVSRTSTPLQRRRDPASHVAIDGAFTSTRGIVPMQNQATIYIRPTDFATGNFGSISLVLPPYPNEEDLRIQPEWTKTQVATFLDFYRSYNKRLLGYIISLDFEKASIHAQNFVKIVPNECKGLLKTPSLHHVITICDDIMFQEATTALLRDCLASLTDDFNVTVRTFAKTLPTWISESRKEDFGVVCDRVSEARIKSALNWSKLVLRVTTLCHVAKEAREMLRYPTVISQLLNELRSVALNDIATQCMFAGYDGTDYVDRNVLAKEITQIANYLECFCNLLQQKASLEMYAQQLEIIVEKHAGLKPELAIISHVTCDADYDVITDQTRQFVKKWAMYTSKMLTEIALKSSESFGTFHLIMLLFGDYIKHMVLLRDEQAKRTKRLRSIIKKDSTYFNRLWISSSGQRLNSRLLSYPSQGKSYHSELPFSVVNPNIAQQCTSVCGLDFANSSKPTRNRDYTLDNHGATKERNNAASVRPYYFSTRSDYIKSDNNQINTVNISAGPAVVVKPAFSNPGMEGSFYLLPGKKMTT